MLSPKIRTTIITVLAAFSFAGATLAPSVSQAAKSRVKVSGSEDKLAQKQWCESLGEMMVGDVEEYENANAEGKTEEAQQFLAKAMNVIKDAKATGCSWASSIRLPSNTTASGVRPPVLSVTAKP